MSDSAASIAEMTALLFGANARCMVACASVSELSDADIEVDAIEWIPLTEVSARLAYADERQLLTKAFEILGVVA